eukprot:scaffold12187_cov135-Isochrysis_galbana.AAC.2
MLDALIDVLNEKYMNKVHGSQAHSTRRTPPTYVPGALVAHATAEPRRRSRRAGLAGAGPVHCAVRRAVGRRASAAPWQPGTARLSRVPAGDVPSVCGRDPGWDHHRLHGRRRRACGGGAPKERPTSPVLWSPLVPQPWPWPLMVLM